MNIPFTRPKQLSHILSQLSTLENELDQFLTREQAETEALEAQLAAKKQDMERASRIKGRLNDWVR